MSTSMTPPPDPAAATLPASSPAAASEPAPSASVEELEDEIVETRERLSDSIDELSDRLNPRLQARRAADDVKAAAAGRWDATRGSASSWLRTGRETVRSHPREAVFAGAAALTTVVGLVIRWIRGAR
ncbi:MAG: DUF3618 domain-containing protein [Actinomycetes bacterium]